MIGVAQHARCSQVQVSGHGDSAAYTVLPYVVEARRVLSYPYPLVVFDLDGTLVDSAADIAEALNRSLQDWQLPRVPEATVLTWIGDGVRRLVEQAFTAAGSDVDLDAVMPGFMRHYEACLLRSPRLFDGVEAALQGLRTRAVPMAICTNKPAALVAPLLQHFGLQDVFALVRYGYPRGLDLDTVDAVAVMDDLQELLAL